MMFTNCPNCGAPVDLDTRYCPYCGSPYVKPEDLKKSGSTLFPLQIDCVGCLQTFEADQSNCDIEVEFPCFTEIRPMHIKYDCPKCNRRFEFQVRYDKRISKSKRITIDDIVCLEGDCQCDIHPDYSEFLKYISRMKEEARIGLSTLSGNSQTFIVGRKRFWEWREARGKSKAVIAEKIETLKTVLDTPLHPLTIFNSPELHLDPNTHLVRSAEREAGLKPIGIRLQELQAQADTDRKAFEEEQNTKRKRDKQFHLWRVNEAIKQFCIFSFLALLALACVSIVVAVFVSAAGFQNVAEQIVKIGFIGGITVAFVFLVVFVGLDFS